MDLHRLETSGTDMRGVRCRTATQPCETPAKEDCRNETSNEAWMGICAGVRATDRSWTR